MSRAEQDTQGGQVPTAGQPSRTQVAEPAGAGSVAEAERAFVGVHEDPGGQGGSAAARAVRGAVGPGGRRC